jgi:hypothetical protein
LLRKKRLNNLQHHAQSVRLKQPLLQRNHRLLPKQNQRWPIQKRNRLLCKPLKKRLSPSLRKA